MTNHVSTSRRTAPVRAWGYIAAAMALGFPGLALRFSGSHLSPDITAAIYGVGIIGAAFLLSWAVEVAQLHISASFAIAILALIAIMPEYSVTAVLALDAGGAWVAGVSPEVIPEVGRVAANVTGANRLLIGAGWSMVVLVYWLKTRKSLVLERGLSLELTVLALATGITFLLFFIMQVAVYIAVILVLLYLFYVWATSRMASEAPELMGPAAVIGTLGRPRQIAMIVLLFLYAALVIFLAAEPFVHGLVETGKALGINEFLLIQWLAPLASEAPEMVVALLFTLRGQPMVAITALISSEVNQLTLLIGSMPVIFSVAFGHPSAFPLDYRQAVEFLLTSSMSLFAVVLLARLRVPWYGALFLLGIFASHLFFTGTEERRIYAFIFLGLAALLLAVDRGRLVEMYRRAVAILPIGNRAKETGPASTPHSSD